VTTYRTELPIDEAWNEKFAVSKGITTIHTRFADWYIEAAQFYPAKGFTDAETSDGLRHMVKQLERKTEC